MVGLFKQYYIKSLAGGRGGNPGAMISYLMMDVLHCRCSVSVLDGGESFITSLLSFAAYQV